MGTGVLQEVLRNHFLLFLLHCGRETVSQARFFERVEETAAEGGRLFLRSFAGTDRVVLETPRADHVVRKGRVVEFENIVIGMVSGWDEEFSRGIDRKGWPDGVEWDMRRKWVDHIFLLCKDIRSSIACVILSFAFPFFVFLSAPSAVPSDLSAAFRDCADDRRRAHFFTYSASSSFVMSWTSLSSNVSKGASFQDEFEDGDGRVERRPGGFDWSGGVDSSEFIKEFFV